MDLLLAAEAAPAGGAETFQVAIATLAAVLMTAGLIFFGQGYRTGKNQVLGDVAGFLSRASGLPVWAGLPVILAGSSLVVAALGFYWDVSIHIDNGRDPGPLANPSHYLILGGLFGIFSAGWLALVLPKDKPGAASVQLGRDWHVPVSGIAMIGCASFALLGFPLDDVSHRLFGQDVTLWGPTHLMMLGGAALTLVSIVAMIAEARAAEPGLKPQATTVADLPLVPRRLRPALDRFDTPIRRGSELIARATTARLRLIYASGGFLIALSIFQAEFDFGVPQFSLLYHPVLIAGAAAIALVCVRSIGGAGAAIGAAIFYCVVRGLLALWVGPVMGQTDNHFALYLVEAGLVELAALVLGTARQWRFGIVSGLAIGTLGVLAEFGWSKLWFPLEWPAQILPEAIALSVVVAVAGGLVGAYVAAAANLRPQVAATRNGRAIATGSLLTIAAAIAFLLPTNVPDASVELTMRDVEPGPGRSVEVTARFRPPETSADPDWITATAWQGRGDLHVSALERVSAGVYRTTEPVPADGSWKSAIRIHRGRDMASAAIFMPADDAIPAAEVPVRAQVTRPLIGDREILQRERKEDVPGWLFGAAGLVVLGFTAAILALIGWVLGRVSGAGVVAAPPSPRPRPPSRARAQERAGVA